MLRSGPAGGLRDLVPSLPAGSFRTMYADAAGATGYGAAMDDRFIQGKWGAYGAQEGINRKESRAPSGRPVAYGVFWVSSRIDSSAAVAYLNFDAGRSPASTTWAPRPRSLASAPRRLCASRGSAMLWPARVSVTSRRRLNASLIPIAN